MSDVAFSFLLGLGTFFSPCAVALVPSYLAYFASRKGEAETPARAAAQALRVGAFAALGVLATFAVLAMGLYLVRERVQVASASLFATFSWLGILVGLTFLVLGGLLVLGRAPSLSLTVTTTLPRSTWAMVAWGVLFAAGSMGCSLPLTLALVARVLADPARAPLQVFAYAAGLSAVLLVSSPVLGWLENRAAGHLVRLARRVQVLMGLLLAGAGLFVAIYYMRVL